MTESSKISYDAQNRPMREVMLPFVPPLFPALRPEWAAGATDMPVPDQDACIALWNKYDVPVHIRNHSREVALIVASLGAKLEAMGVNINRPLLLAGSLLHDIAKAYTIEYGGNHAQLGGAWVCRETGNYNVAQMVFHHVHWPWELDVNNESMLPALLLVYADKRVRHDEIVTMQERFKDLMRRYGHTELSRMYIQASLEQGLDLEAALSTRLGVDLHEYSFNSRRLV
ncbi:HD domain-containing protein [Desulfovibrio sp. OttesenSCG-928-F07]|nr:HD domain-containing protein [Desulfovibrio sp. OttesenSCG-928-F07]